MNEKEIINNLSDNYTSLQRIKAAADSPAGPATGSSLRMQSNKKNLTIKYVF